MIQYYIEFDPTGADAGVYNNIWKADLACGEFECIRGRIDLRGKIGPDGDVIASIKALPLDAAIHPSNRALDLIQCLPGEYYHRIARPVLGNGMPDHIVNWDDHELIIRSQMGGQLDWLLKELREICQTIHPSDKTFKTYGHAIRNILILACTEVEAGWKGVLRSNGYAPLDKNGALRDLTTADYAKVAPVLKLAEYSVRFSPYPWLAPIKPFENWETGKPSQSLAWYKAYNDTKHDRENKFEEATLENAFNAVAACAIILVAQFGNFSGSRAGESITINDKPTWSWAEHYVPGNQVGIQPDLRGVNYMF